jgi:hypothetical protein
MKKEAHKDVAQARFCTEGCPTVIRKDKAERSGIAMEKKINGTCTYA